MLNSTVHWKQLLNGYSGFAPGSYYEHFGQIGSFPSRDSVAALQRLGVTHAFVHREAMAAERFAEVEQLPEFERVAAEASIVLYRIKPMAAAQRK
jgi:hypothetical protein